MELADARAAWSEVYNAYQNTNPPNLCPGQASQIALLVKRWVETKDPSLMDALISYCHQKSLPILPETLKYVNAAMQKRIRDGSSGTKAFRSAAKQALLEEMAKMIYHGATFARAAELAAYASHKHFSFNFKASTLERAYAKQREALERFADLVCGNPNLTEEEAKERASQWRAIIEQPLDVPQDIKGARR